MKLPIFTIIEVAFFLPGQNIFLFENYMGGFYCIFIFINTILGIQLTGSTWGQPPLKW